MGKIWSPDCKFWLPTYFVYNSQNSTKVNMILYFTLRTRKVPKEELKLLKTVLAWVRPIATVVLKWYVSGPKVMILLKLFEMERNTKNLKSVVFMVRHTGPFVYSLFISSKCGSSFSSPFTADKQHCAWPRLLAAIVLMANEKCNDVVVHLPSQFWKRLLKQYGVW